ncbi:phage holin family protein [Arthrobacter castelli]|uniref:phage holin family protein n=1 Tax=Arthrobacter castelli TaxID=271431 RepID=UPI0004031DFC|nr:phage holin family protein [Arthrobacter castelli]
MGAFLIRVLINGVALWIASWILGGMTISSAGAEELAQGNETIAVGLSYLFVGLIFGVVNALVKPIVSLLSLPITIITLGLFTIVINAAMLMLTSWLSSFTPIGLQIDAFFWTAIFGAIIVSIVSLIAGTVTGTRK